MQKKNTQLAFSIVPHEGHRRILLIPVHLSCSWYVVCFFLLARWLAFMMRPVITVSNKGKHNREEERGWEALFLCLRHGNRYGHKMQLHTIWVSNWMDCLPFMCRIIWTAPLRPLICSQVSHPDYPISGNIFSQVIHFRQWILWVWCE